MLTRNAVCWPVLGTVFVIASVFVPVNADTLYLKNGYQLDGQVDEAESTPTEVVLRVGEAGTIHLARSRILQIEQNERRGRAEEEPQVTGPLQVVHLRQGLYLARGRQAREGLVGVLSETVYNGHKLLQIPGLGQMRIPVEFIDRVEPYSAPEGPVAAAGGAIPTSHVVELKNGNSLRGNVVPTDETAPLILRLGHLGRLFIPRDRVQEVRQEAGEYQLPPPAPAEEAREAPAETSQDLPEGGEVAEVVGEEPPRTDPELEEEIYDLLHELTRQRTRNRVRAERKLKDLGEVVVPYLDVVINHPFNLTRRAAMRIIRDAGNPAGLPFAKFGLRDEDKWVRRLAGEAVRRLQGAN